MPVIIIRPSDTQASPWSGGAAPHHAQINEAIINPTPGTTGSIGAGKKENNEVEIFGIPNIADLGVLTSITFNAEGRNDSDEDDIGTGFYSYLQVGDTQVGRGFHSFNTPGDPFAWRSRTISGLSISKAQFDAATFRLESGNMEKDEEFDCRTAYMEITYNLPVSEYRGGEFRGGDFR